MRAPRRARPEQSLTRTLFGSRLLRQTCVLHRRNDLRRIRSLFKCRGVRILAILDHREVAAQLLDEVNELRYFLLGEKIDLQIQVFAFLRHLGLAALGNQHHGGSKQGNKGEQPLQPYERRGIDRMTRETKLNRIEPDPAAYDRQQHQDVCGSGDETADALQTPLRQTGVLNFLLSTAARLCASGASASSPGSAVTKPRHPVWMLWVRGVACSFWYRARPTGDIHQSAHTSSSQRLLSRMAVVMMPTML